VPTINTSAFQLVGTLRFAHPTIAPLRFIRRNGKRNSAARARTENRLSQKPNTANFRFWCKAAGQTQITSRDWQGMSRELISSEWGSGNRAEGRIPVRGSDNRCPQPSSIPDKVAPYSQKTDLFHVAQ
jgi:hypothetical protein